ncbi:permease [bacterium]|nr:permease [bacterium]
MLISTLIMAVLAASLLYIGYSKGENQHIMGLKIASKIMVDIVPLLFCALIVAGMVQTLIPQEQISKWVGAESGIKGILVGTVAGGFSPGGPFVSLPIAVALVKSGSSVGTMVAFLTGWSLWAIARLPMEVGILGWKLTLIRFASTFFFPPIAGLFAQFLFGWVKNIS